MNPIAIDPRVLSTFLVIKKIVGLSLSNVRVEALKEILEKDDEEFEMVVDFMHKATLVCYSKERGQISFTSCGIAFLVAMEKNHEENQIPGFCDSDQLVTADQEVALNDMSALYACIGSRPIVANDFRVDDGNGIVAMFVREARVTASLFEACREIANDGLSPNNEGYVWSASRQLGCGGPGG